MINFKKRTTPGKHPPVELGFTRIELPEVEATTDKATLLGFEYGVKIWVPKSLFKIRWGYSGQVEGDDKQSVIDIATWFYEKEIEKQLLSSWDGKPKKKSI